MVDQAVQVSYRTFFRHCAGVATWAKHSGYATRSDKGLTLDKDWHVSFYRSKFRGKPCYYMYHSAIEYIWVLEDQ